MVLLSSVNLSSFLWFFFLSSEVVKLRLRSYVTNLLPKIHVLHLSFKNPQYGPHVQLIDANWERQVTAKLDEFLNGNSTGIVLNCIGVLWLVFCIDSYKVTSLLKGYLNEMNELARRKKMEKNEDKEKGEEKRRGKGKSFEGGFILWQNSQRLAQLFRRRRQKRRGRFSERSVSVFSSYFSFFSHFPQSLYCFLQGANHYLKSSPIYLCEPLFYVGQNK